MAKASKPLLKPVQGIHLKAEVNKYSSGPSTAQLGSLRDILKEKQFQTSTLYSLHNNRLIDTIDTKQTIQQIESNRPYLGEDKSTMAGSNILNRSKIVLGIKGNNNFRKVRNSTSFGSPPSTLIHTHAFGTQTASPNQSHYNARSKKIPDSGPHQEYTPREEIKMVRIQKPGTSSINHSQDVLRGRSKYAASQMSRHHPNASLNDQYGNRTVLSSGDDMALPNNKFTFNPKQKRHSLQKLLVNHGMSNSQHGFSTKSATTEAFMHTVSEPYM